MSSNLRFFVTIVGVALVLITAIILKKGRVPVKYSLILFKARTDRKCILLKSFIN